MPLTKMSETKTICKQSVKDYCANCSFAGIHYIGDDTKHWTERLLWLLLVILSWYGSAILIIAAWDAFILSPISFGVDTVYLDWDTKMPTVVVCETRNERKLNNVSDTIWTKNHLPDLEAVLAEIVYYRGISNKLIFNCHDNPNPDPMCPLSNYSYYAELVRSECHKFLKNCSYNNEEFPCCDYFLPLDTDMGICYAINSVQTRCIYNCLSTRHTIGHIDSTLMYYRQQNPYPMVSNMKNHRGSIKFDLTLPATVYVLGDDEVPTVTTPASSAVPVSRGNYYRQIVSNKNIVNHPFVRQTTIEQRDCRFYDENEDGLYPQYSYSACTVLCRKRAQLAMCHCCDHFMPNTSVNERCNITGMACLHSYSDSLTVLKPAWSRTPGITCDCLPSCDETEVENIHISTLKQVVVKTRARVEIVLAYLPTERFKRNVVRSRMDLVVSVGGTTSLFVGASVLSFIELFFFFTVRLMNNLWMNRRSKDDNSPLIIPYENRDLKQNTMKYKYVSFQDDQCTADYKNIFLPKKWLCMMKNKMIKLSWFSTCSKVLLNVRIKIIRKIPKCF